jgi:putative spermidine/putrescine transport system substrate-binding protein
VPDRKMARAGMMLVAGVVLSSMAACGGGADATTSASGTGKAGDWSTAQSVKAGGSMDSLIAAAKKEGTLNLIAVPRTWANYGAIIDGFAAKYGITINSENPDGSSGDEINAIKSTKGQSSAPDVVDVGNSYALSGAQEGLYAPYQVSTWNDIPAAQKDPGGLWYSDYGGYVSIGCNTAKVGTCPTTFKDLDNPAYKGMVSLNGDPTSANSAFNAVWAAALANGGSASDIQPGLDFFAKLNSEGIFNKTQVTDATVASGETPIVLDWDYLNVANADAVKSQGITWKTSDPSDGLVSSYYAQAVSINAPHPAAARLWEEYLYSDEGQNLWLKGSARPIRLAAMQKDGTADKAALAAIPTVHDEKPFNPTQDQITAAKAVVTQKWAPAVA